MQNVSSFDQVCFIDFRELYSNFTHNFRSRFSTNIRKLTASLYICVVCQLITSIVSVYDTVRLPFRQFVCVYTDEIWWTKCHSYFQLIYDSHSYYVKWRLNRLPIDNNSFKMLERVVNKNFSFAFNSFFLYFEHTCLYSFSLSLFFLEKNAMTIDGKHITR